MDGSRFDALARSLSTVRSRRGLTRLLAGLTLSGVVASRGAGEASAALLLGGAGCTSKTQCKSGRCLKPAKATCDCTKKSCKCTCACSADPVVRCVKPADPCKKAVCSAAGRCVAKPKCAGTSTECKTVTCDNGTCGTSFAGSGTPVAAQTAGDCKLKCCDGAGGTFDKPDESDVPAEDACTVGTCIGDIPGHKPKADGTDCPDGKCLNGICTPPECAVAEECPGTDTECHKRECNGGTCGVKFAPDDSPCMGGTCQSGKCV